MSEDTPSVFLLDWLNHYSPKTVLAVSDAPIPALEHFNAIHDQTSVILTDGIDVTLTGSISCAVVSNFLETREKKYGEEFLARLRNYLLPQILVFLNDENTPWSFDDFLKLGFRDAAKFRRQKQRLTIFEYNIADYNFKRTWNSPKNWANPELFGKYWW